MRSHILRARFFSCSPSLGLRSLAPDRRWQLASLALLMVAVTAIGPAAAQAPPQAGGQTASSLSDADRQAVAAVAQSIRTAGTLYQAGDFAKSGQQIDQAVEAIQRLTAAGDAAVYDTLAPLFARLINAHALLELEGVELVPFERPTRPAAAQPSASPATKPQPTKPQTDPAASGMSRNADAVAAATDSAATDPAAGNRRNRRGRGNAGSPGTNADRAAGPSFVREVAPILVQRCGNCHIQEAQGEFSVANFALLSRGTPAGTVVFPGDVVASRLIESIETGDMPRGGQQVSPQELQTLKDWVLAGARYDAPSPLVPLVAMATSAAANPQPAGPAMGGGAAAGRGGANAMRGNSPNRGAAMDSADNTSATSGTVSFAKQIAPILLEHCSGCHIDANQVRGGLRLDTFALLLRGGAGGTIVEPGDAEGSSLIRRLKGEDEPRMPAGRPPLSEQQIALIATWIEENAQLDAASPDQPLRRMATEAWAAGASDEQLTERRQELAKQNMALAGVGSSELFELESERFYVLGNTNQATAEAIQQAAESVFKRLGSKLDLSSLRGRTTVFVMPKRYDYSEFAKMVEQRSIPAGWQAHWRHDPVDSYLVVLGSPSDSVKDWELRITAPLTSLVVASLGGDVPTWFAEGVGRNESAASRGRDGAEELARWNAAVPIAARAMERGEQVEQAQLSPEQIESIGYGAVAAMQQAQRRQYAGLLKNLGSGPFAELFQQALGITPTAYLDQWKPAAGLGLERRR